jgi:hypothetical protein
MFFLEGVDHLLEPGLVGGHGFGRAGEFDKDVAGGSFDDGAQQAVVFFDGFGGFHGTAHAGVIAGGVDGGDGQSVDGSLGDFGVGGAAGGREDLGLPAVEIGLDGSALAGAEEVNDALGAGGVAGEGRDQIGGGAHGAGSPIVFPAGGWGPFKSGDGIGEEGKSEGEEKKAHGIILAGERQRTRSIGVSAGVGPF